MNEDTCQTCGHACHCDETKDYPPHNECPECAPNTEQGGSCPICACQGVNNA